MEPTGEPVSVPSIQHSVPRSQWIVVLVLAFIAAGVLAVYQLGIYPPIKAPTQSDAPLAHTPQNNSLPLYTDLVPLLALPEIFSTSSRSLDWNVIPLPHDALFRRDAQNVVVNAAQFDDGATGYVASYTIPSGDLMDVCGFYAGALSKGRGWAVKSRRTDVMCTYEAEREGYRVTGIVSPGDGIIQISLTIRKQP